MQSLFSRPPFEPTRMPYRVHTYGRVADSARHATMGTYNNDAMLTVFLRGTGYYRRQDAVQTITGGMVGIVLPGPEVGILLSDENDAYEHVFCRFAGALALATAKRILQARGGENFSPCPFWLEVAQPLIAMLGNRLPLQAEDRVYADRTRPCDAMLAQALAILDCPSGPEPGLTARAVASFIAERLSMPTDLDVMAGFFGVTKEYLCRRVKALTGRTPLELWRDAKIRWAKTLLEHARLDVWETARRVGFDDPYYFSRVFKRCTGHSPSHFLALARKAGANANDSRA